MKNKNLIDGVTQVLRNIYSAKTIIQRSDEVDVLLELIEEETVFGLYIAPYLTRKYLDLWTSLYKLSQYAEHSSNYLERLFKEVSYNFF